MLLGSEFQEADLDVLSEHATPGGVEEQVNIALAKAALVRRKERKVENNTALMAAFASKDRRARSFKIKMAPTVQEFDEFVWHDGFSRSSFSLIFLLLLFARSTYCTISCYSTPLNLLERGLYENEKAKGQMPGTNDFELRPPQLIRDMNSVCRNFELMRVFVSVRWREVGV